MTGLSLRIVALTLIATLVSGCGFYLKGSAADGQANSLSGQNIAVMSEQPRSELTAALTRQLRLAGAVFTDPTADTLILKVGAEEFQQRNLSLTAQARSAEVELTMQARISLTRSGTKLVDGETASIVRQFLNDPRNVVGKTEELRLLREEMRRDLAAQIVRRTSHSLGN